MGDCPGDGQGQYVYVNDSLFLRCNKDDALHEGHITDEAHKEYNQLIKKADHMRRNNQTDLGLGRLEEYWQKAHEDRNRHMAWRYKFPDTINLIEACDICRVCQRFEYSSPNKTCCKGCPSGYDVSEHCTVSHTNSKCEPCPEGTFRRIHDDMSEDDERHFGNGKCVAWSQCPKHTHKVRNGTSRRDVFCEPDEGYFCVKDPPYVSCSVVKKIDCPPGQRVIVKATRSSGPVCGQCDDGQFMSTETITKLSCKTRTHCEWGIAKAGTYNRDDICNQSPDTVNEL